MGAHPIRMSLSMAPESPSPAAPRWVSATTATARLETRVKRPSVWHPEQEQTNKTDLAE